jgi:hypothetical protein
VRPTFTALPARIKNTPQPKLPAPFLKLEEIILASKYELFPYTMYYLQDLLWIGISAIYLVKGGFCGQSITHMLQ